MKRSRKGRRWGALREPFEEGLLHSILRFRTGTRWVPVSLDRTDEQPSTRLKYATLGVLFVNVSIGGTLTQFAAPPVLMVARPWGWDIPFMLANFGSGSCSWRRTDGHRECSEPGRPGAAGSLL